MEPRTDALAALSWGVRCGTFRLPSSQLTADTSGSGGAVSAHPARPRDGLLWRTPYRIGDLANRARRIKRYLSQNMLVAEQFTGRPGSTVPREETVEAFDDRASSHRRPLLLPAGQLTRPVREPARQPDREPADRGSASAIRPAIPGRVQAHGRQDRPVDRVVAAFPWLLRGRSRRRAGR